MKVILRENVRGVGAMGDVLEVAAGHARNYLLPRNLAMEATGRNLQAVEHAKRVLAEQARKEKSEIEACAKKISATAVTITVQVGKDDKLFGSVTTKDIAAALAVQGLEVDKRNIHLEHPIKELGMVAVLIKLHPEVTATVRVTVVKAVAPAETTVSA